MLIQMTNKTNKKAELRIVVKLSLLKFVVEHSPEYYHGLSLNYDVKSESFLIELESFLISRTVHHKNLKLRDKNIIMEIIKLED